MEEFNSAKLIAKVEREDRTLFRELEALWCEVKPGIQSVVKVFPEYTPHDATHLRRLFELSEKILGAEILEQLNNTESFPLAAGIIAHDWGMGVSPSEQQAILGGHQGVIDMVGPDSKSFQQALLPDEQRRLHQHCLTRGIKLTWNEEMGCLADPNLNEHWRDYLRDTHPERSAWRIRQHFTPRQEAIGHALALIAHGHGRETAEIENTYEYPVKMPLNKVQVNLQALTLYLRLIDLLDIGRGRTPYELWRFDNPGNQRSALEWKKHHAMEEPVFDAEYIILAANPDSGVILAELFNLKRVCEREFEWQRRLLKHSSPTTYLYPRAC